MTWIRTVAEDEATAEVAGIYAREKRAWGGVDEIVKAYSLSAPALQSMMLFYEGLMHGASPLSMARREMIAVTVSVLNECHY